jgi:RimJ/RimL family protein N-acetyltransferase
MHIETERLRLRVWEEADRDHFATLNADPAVMKDLGGPLSRDDSDAKLDRYLKAWKSYAHGRWLVETISGRFLGYCGVMPARGAHPIGIHDEIGWRLIREAWGHGYATEAARAALIDVFRRAKLIEVLAYTDVQNIRSQAVMRRLGLRRDASRDFTIYSDRLGTWRGLVWTARENLIASAGAERGAVDPPSGSEEQDHERRMGN